MHNPLYRNKTRSIFIIGLLLVSLLYFVFFEQNDRNIINGITVFGTYLSLFGIIISYLQIKSVSSINLETKLVIEKSLQRMNQLALVADLSKATMMIREIQEQFEHANYRIALARMKDLKVILIQTKHSEIAILKTGLISFNKELEELFIDIINLNDYISGTKKKQPNTSKINKNLEILSTTLTEIESKLKNIKNDS